MRPGKQHDGKHARRLIARVAALVVMCAALTACGILPPFPTRPSHDLAALTLFSASPSPAPTATASPRSTPSPTPVSSPTPVPTPEPPEEIIISCVGDCTLGGDPRIGQLAAFRAVVEQNDPGYCFLGALPYTSEDSLTIANMEGPLTSNEFGAEKEFSFRGDPVFAAIFEHGGVEVVSLANNHAMDYGDDGYAHTLAALEAEGIAAADEGRPAVYRAGEWSIGVAAGKFPTRERIAQLKADIARLREEGCAVVVAVMHWGDEGADVPPPGIRETAHAAIDAGADLVVGHHPHILQGVEEYNGRMIAYSLGNFVFGGNRDPKERETAIFQQRFIAQDGKLVPAGFRVLPFTVSATAPGNDYQPKELQGDAAKRVFDRINTRGSLTPAWVEVTGEWQ